MMDEKAGFRIFYFEDRVETYKDRECSKDPAWLDHLRSRAGEALAGMISRDAAFHYTIDPKDPSDPMAETIHRWVVGIVDRSAAEARHRDVERGVAEGRSKALSEAVEAARRQAQLLRARRQHDAADALCDFADALVRSQME